LAFARFYEAWDKVSCYWEHVGEDIGDLRNMLGEYIENLGYMLGTQWELNKNTLVTTNM
jgi:hypothetical protein